MAQAKITKPLTSAQLKYAAQRVNAIASAKEREFEKLHGPGPKSPGTPAKSKLDMIRSGKAVLKPNVGSYDYLVDAYTYPTSKAEAKFEADLKEWRKKKDDFQEDLFQKRRALLDKLYLSGADEALAAIEQFASLNLNKI